MKVVCQSTVAVLCLAHLALPTATKHDWRGNFPWLVALTHGPVVRELQALADEDMLQSSSAAGGGKRFAEGFSPNSNLVTVGAHGGWTAVPLMNKGALLVDGCAALPQTCAALASIAGHLAPRRGQAEEVGVRLLKLAPGASLRPHVGPGGRLVAHLGVRVPAQGAQLLIEDHVHRWAEGQLIVFNDSVTHSVHNMGATPRYILHVAFPIPDTPVHVETTPHARFEIFSDCTVQVTNLRNNIASVREPLALLYNRVADSRSTNLEACIGAQVVVTPPQAAAGVTAVQVAAAHGYGRLTVGIEAGLNWFTFTLLDISAWNADPVEKHLVWARMCPTDMCPVLANASLGNSPATQSIKSAPFVRGRFMGFRGSEGEYPDSAGFLTISSTWQSFNQWLYAKQGEKLAFTLCPTSELPQVRAQLQKAESMPGSKPNLNRAGSWWWVGGCENTLNRTIETALAMGVELLFFESISLDGDYSVDAKCWPSGLAHLRSRLTAAGLQIGMHMLSSGSPTCFGYSSVFWPGNTTNTTPCVEPSIIKARPDVFVQQGLAPRDWYWAQTAGTWYCHDVGSKVCYDHTRSAGCNRPNQPGCVKPGGPPGGYIAPPQNPIVLKGGDSDSQRWSKFGRFRSGGSVLFDGRSTYGLLKHTPEYNFTLNHFYPRALSEFTVQMVVHPVGPTVGGTDQVLASKPGEWRLSINPAGVVEWAVSLAGKMVVAQGTTVLKTYAQGGRGYVVKACHSGGTIKLFVCVVAPDFTCDMPNPEATAHGSLPIGSGTASVTFGAEVLSATAVIDASTTAGDDELKHWFSGSLEEVFFSRVSLEDVHAFLWSGPDTGCVNWHVFDYTRPQARAYWAAQMAGLINSVGASVAQWDGSEFQQSLAGWDVPHSSNTVHSEFPMGYFAGYGGSCCQGDPNPRSVGKYMSPLFKGAMLEAFTASRALWVQPTAIELSMNSPGLGPWRGLDMAPFADEKTIKGPLCSEAGDSWHEHILLAILSSGVMVNGYHTDIAGSAGYPSLQGQQLDCFIGGLVAIGIGPQLSGNPSDAAVLARLKFWLDLNRRFGQATESTITALYYPTVFLVGLRGGTVATPSYGFYGGVSNVSVALPADFETNATVLTFQSADATCINLTIANSISAITFFAANNLTLALHGSFWSRGAGEITQTITALNGSKSVSKVVVPVSTKSHTVHLVLGDFCRFDATRRPLNKQDLRAAL